MNIAAVLVALMHFTVAFSQQEVASSTGSTVSLYNLETTVAAGIEIPEVRPQVHITSHFAYSLEYSEEHEQAAWVAYELTSEETIPTVKRANKFLVDPSVNTGTANDKDYAGKGYDRGHLAPAGDMAWSSTAMKESFYYSNMSPQVPGFNRGVWKRVEEQVRAWALEHGSVYIITGPVLVSDLPRIGANKVSVPKYFYKVILDYREPGIKGLGFVIPNASSKEPLQKFAVSIDSVENLVGLNFFPLLPDDQEELIERDSNIVAWTWKSVNPKGKGAHAEVKQRDKDKQR